MDGGGGVGISAPRHVGGGKLGRRLADKLQQYETCCGADEKRCWIWGSAQLLNAEE